MFVGEVGPPSGWQKIISRTNVTLLLECEDMTPDTTEIPSHGSYKSHSFAVIEPFHKPKKIWLIFATRVFALDQKILEKEKSLLHSNL